MPTHPYVFSLPSHLPTSDPRVLNVSRGEHLSEVSASSTSQLQPLSVPVYKGSGKGWDQEVSHPLPPGGLRHSGTQQSSQLGEPSNTSPFQSLLRILDRKDIDTLIADIHGKDLEVEVNLLRMTEYALSLPLVQELVARLSGLASPASRFSWIFTSLLSSDMLVQVKYYSKKIQGSSLICVCLLKPYFLHQINHSLQDKVLPNLRPTEQTLSINEGNLILTGLKLLPMSKCNVYNGNNFRPMSNK